MKKITVTAILALVGFVTAGSALAQTHEVRANVPFDFAVGDKVLPAGQYSIVSESAPESTDEILIRNNEQPQFAILVRTFGEPQGWATRSSLVFDHYGSQYFLREIRGPVAAVNAEIPTSKSEKIAQSTNRAALSDAHQTLVALR